MPKVAAPRGLGMAAGLGPQDSDRRLSHLMGPPLRQFCPVAVGVEAYRPHVPRALQGLRGIDAKVFLDGVPAFGSMPFARYRRSRSLVFQTPGRSRTWQRAPGHFSGRKKRGDRGTVGIAICSRARSRRQGERQRVRRPRRIRSLAGARVCAAPLGIAARLRSSGEGSRSCVLCPRRVLVHPPRTLADRGATEPEHIKEVLRVVLLPARFGGQQRFAALLQRHYWRRRRSRLEAAFARRCDCGGVLASVRRPGLELARGDIHTISTPAGWRQLGACVSGQARR